MASVEIDGSEERCDLDQNNSRPRARVVGRATPIMNTIRQEEGDRKYRGGFSTSICQFFDDPHRRNDCCALSCLGVLSSDRTKHLMQQHFQQQQEVSSPPAPQSLWSLWIPRALPILLFLMMQIFLKTARNNKTKNTNQKASTQAFGFLFLAFIASLVFLAVRSGRIRMKTRMDLMNILKEHNANEQTVNNNTDETLLNPRAEAYHAHGRCGCVSGYGIDGILSSSEQQGQSDLCTKIWNFARACCCGSFCGCWLQCCGMCAIGQEEREINRMLPRVQQMIDYITFQPYVEYYLPILQLRRSTNWKLTEHFKALSDLSKRLIGVLISYICLCFLYAFLETFLFALFDAKQNFTLPKFFVLLFTFGQAFLVLYFVHWRWNRFDLSFDAVVKYFACGFLISVTFALVYETLVQIIFGIIGAIVFDVEIVSDGTAEELSKENPKEDSERIFIDFFKRHPGLIIAYAFINAFIVAAFVEEMSKYFGFWMVEHPDFLPLEELEEQENYIKTARQEDGESNDQNSLSSNILSHERTLNQIGAAITVAMVSVATGFACCENIMYIFVYAPSNLTSQISTLLLRSIFPVHPLCAAIQSIGVCKRDLEKDESMKLGKVIFPAFLVHGTFDFILMVIATFESINHTGEKKKETEATDDSENTDVSDIGPEILSFVISILVVIVSYIYYVIASRRQKVRLEQRDLNQNASEIEQDTLLIT
jgi:RsiW-degrading membrane proteinase PrsW (M82 family)/preprotein translocase subunit YajC